MPGALIREGAKPCSLGPGKGSGRASSGTHVVPRPGASPAPGIRFCCGCCCSGGFGAAFLCLASCLDPLAGGIGQPGSPELILCPVTKFPPSQGTRVSSFPVPTWISASCTLHPETQHSFLGLTGNVCSWVGAGPRHALEVVRGVRPSPSALPSCEEELPSHLKCDHS